MRVLMSGASGMVGNELAAALRRRGDSVTRLVRQKPHDIDEEIYWDPADEVIDTQAIEDGAFDAVLHLAGEPLAGRWSLEKKERIRSSRVAGTKLLSSTIANIDNGVRPRAFLCASATGWYGDCAEELVSEDSHSGDGFLAEAVSDWEQSCDPVIDAGIRVAKLRMAPVQSPSGGALAQLLLPFKLGLGGKIGPGNQWWPWIGLQEAVRIWLFVLDNEIASGAINLVGPTPARNREYVRALGRSIHRPAIIPAPSFMLKAMLGAELVEEMLLTSQKVVPARLEAWGYEFLDRTIEQALARELGR